MRNAVLTGIVAGTMGYATLAGARETAPVSRQVEFELSIVVAEADQVAAELTSAQRAYSRLAAARNDYLGRLRVLNLTRRGVASDEAAWLRAAVTRLNGQLEDLVITISELQQALARLLGTIERMTPSGVPVQPLGEPAI